MEKRVKQFRTVCMILMALSAVITAILLLMVTSQINTLTKVFGESRELYAEYTDEQIRQIFTAYFLSYGADLIVAILALVCSIRGFTTADDIKNSRRRIPDADVCARIAALWPMAIACLAACALDLIFGILVGGPVFFRGALWIIAAVFFWFVRGFRPKKAEKKA